MHVFGDIVGCLSIKSIFRAHSQDSYPQFLLVVILFPMFTASSELAVLLKYGTYVPLFQEFRNNILISIG